VLAILGVLALGGVGLSATPAFGSGGGEEAAGHWTLGGVRCDLIGVPSTGTLDGSACPGVRPGALVDTDIGQCTFNFLFRDQAGHRYMGTAGHCILPSPEVGDANAGEHTWRPGSGPVARDGNGTVVGRFVYAILVDPKDFALVRLYRNVAASPQMCQFGGPTGLNRDRTTQPVTLEHYGQGVGTGQVAPGREAEALSMANPDHVYALGAAAPGDSGSGVQSADGRAVGVLVTAGLHFNGPRLPADAGSMGITRLAPQKTRAAQVLGVRLTLVTAPAS
jgi:hypothetical protein